MLCNDFMNGTSFYGWLHQHVLGHHVYCNSYGIDPDVRPFPLRLTPVIVRALCPLSGTLTATAIPAS